MANPSASTSVTAETMLLDIDKITPEKWRTLIYNKIVKQKDVCIECLNSYYNIFQYKISIVDIYR